MNNTICLLGINFYPEDSAIGLYSTQLACYLSKHDNDVSVITGFPYYPEWKIRKEYQDKSVFLAEKLNGIQVYRYKQYVPINPSFKSRLLHLTDFTLGSFLNLFKIKKCDAVICVVPFTSTIFLGWILSRFKGAKLWVHIQDFEVDAILESGISSNKGFFRKKLFSILYSTERFLLNRADIVSTISFGMLKKLEGKTNRETYYFPNWVDGNDINPELSSMHPCYKNHADQFKILYSGNTGEKQDWDFFLKIVSHFKRSDAVHFFIVGQGAKYGWLQQQLSKFDNVTVREPVPFEELNNLLCSADLHVLFQKKDVIDTVMPSKILGMMASEVPSLVTGNLESEVAQVFAESQKDGFFEAGQKERCVEFIDSLIKSNEKRKIIGTAARDYILGNFDSNIVLPEFNKRLNQLIST